MIDEVRLLDEIDGTMYASLWKNLTGITEAELDWRPHPEANSARWILGHMVWNEEWVADTIGERGRYLADEAPLAYELASIGEIRARYDRARTALRAALAGIGEADMARDVDYFGQDYTLRQVLITHTTHLAGSRYQIRYVRGTYSRAHATRKADFDPW